MNSTLRGALCALALTAFALPADAQVSGTPSTIPAQLGPTNEAAASSPAAAKGLNGVLKGFWTDLRSLFGAAGAPSSVVVTVQGASGSPTPLPVQGPAGAALATAAGQSTNGGKLDTLHADVGTTVHGDLTTANGKLDTLHADVAAGTAQAVTNGGKLDTLHTDVAAGTAQAAANGGKLDTLHTDVAAGTAQAVTNGGKLDTLHTDVGTTVHGDLTTANGKLDTLHADVIAGTTQAATNGGKLDTLHADVAAGTAQAVTNGGKLDTLHTDVAAGTAQAVTNGGKLDTLHTDVGAAQATPGSDASKAQAVQGVTGGKPVSTLSVDSGNVDITDPATHSMKITCVVGCSGGGGSGSNASVGANGATTPGSSTAIGGFDASSFLQQFRAENGPPGATDWGLNIWGYQLGTGGPLYQAISQPPAPQATTGVDIGAVENNVNMGNAQVQMHVCGSQATVNPSTATDTQLVAPVSGKNIYVCGVEISSNGANNVNLESATAASCGGTLTAIGTTWYTTQFFAKIAADFVYRGKNTGTGNGLCVHTTAAQNVSVTVYYDQY